MENYIITTKQITEDLKHNRKHFSFKCKTKGLLGCKITKKPSSIKPTSTITYDVKETSRTTVDELKTYWCRSHKTKT